MNLAQLVMGRSPSRCFFRRQDLVPKGSSLIYCCDELADVFSSSTLFLVSLLSNSLAKDSFITLLRRSRRSAPCSVASRLASILLQHRSGCVCGCFPSFLALHPEHPNVAPWTTRSCLAIISLFFFWARNEGHREGRDDGRGKPLTMLLMMSTVGRTILIMTMRDV